MDFIGYYQKENRPDLSDKALDVLAISSLPVPPNAPDGTEPVFRLGSDYRLEYRYYLMGLTRRKGKLHKAALEFLKQGDGLLPLINQINVYLIDELARKELYEVIPRALEINQGLADAIESEFPHLDVSPLRSTEKANEELKKLLDQLERHKRGGLC
jgi:hypothetical protein